MTPSCQCKTWNEHQQASCDFRWRGKPNTKQTQGKKTSEGYKPEPNEKVELRGD